MIKKLFPNMEKVEMTPEMKEKFSRIRKNIREKGADKKSAFSAVKQYIKREE